MFLRCRYGYQKRIDCVAQIGRGNPAIYRGRFAGYLSLDGLLKSVNLPADSFCTACFTGEYPIPVQLEMDKLALENS